MKLTKRLAAVVLAAILSLVMLTACSGNVTPDDPSGRQLDAYRQEVLRLINAERAKVDGLEPLTAGDINLNNAAQKRAQELPTSFTHTRPDGRNWSTVLSECSVHYQWRYDEIIRKASPTPASLVSDMQFADEARQDMLSNQFTQVGIGYVEKDGQYYWTLIYIA